MTEMKNDNRKLEGKLVESIAVEGLGGLAQDYGELGLDVITGDELKAIPIISTIVNLSKAVLSVRDRLYVRKLLCFLQKVGETTQEQREKFVEDNCQNVRRFEEAVLLILEQADRMEKSLLIGKIFKACILGEITYGDARKLSSMVNRAYWEDIEELIAGVNVKITENNHSLVHAGFFEIGVRGGGYRSRYSGGGVSYDITGYGKILHQMANR